MIDQVIEFLPAFPWIFSFLVELVSVVVVKISIECVEFLDCFLVQGNVSGAFLPSFGVMIVPGSLPVITSFSTTEIPETKTCLIPSAY